MRLDFFDQRRALLTTLHLLPQSSDCSTLSSAAPPCLFRLVFPKKWCQQSRLQSWIETKGHIEASRSTSGCCLMPALPGFIHVSCLDVWSCRRLPFYEVSASSLLSSSTLIPFYCSLTSFISPSSDDHHLPWLTLCTLHSAGADPNGHAASRATTLPAFLSGPVRGVITFTDRYALCAPCDLFHRCCPCHHPPHHVLPNCHGEDLCMPVSKLSCLVPIICFKEMHVTSCVMHASKAHCICTF
jgi:hypothetical protein